MDIIVFLALVGSFAVLLTAHVTLAVGLGRRRPRWRGPVALVVPPLAPYWGLESGLKRRALVWLAALCCYILARLLASV